MYGPTLAKLDLIGIVKPHISREEGVWKVRDGSYWAMGFTISSAWEGVRKAGRGRWRGGRRPVPPCSPSCRHL